MAPTIDLDVSGPPEATVGGDVTFEIAYTNRSQITASGLIIKDRLGDGLEHAELGNHIEWALEPLPPGKTERIGVTLRVTQAGRLCPHGTDSRRRAYWPARKHVSPPWRPGHPPVMPPPTEIPRICQKDRPCAGRRRRDGDVHYNCHQHGQSGVDECKRS